jgi:outer membrane biogenesis lipoprotein LolB
MQMGNLSKFIISGVMVAFLAACSTTGDWQQQRFKPKLKLQQMQLKLQQMQHNKLQQMLLNNSSKHRKRLKHWRTSSILILTSPPLKLSSVLHLTATLRI